MQVPHLILQGLLPVIKLAAQVETVHDVIQRDLCVIGELILWFYCRRLTRNVFNYVYQYVDFDDRVYLHALHKRVDQVAATMKLEVQSLVLWNRMIVNQHFLDISTCILEIVFEGRCYLYHIQI